MHEVVIVERKGFVKGVVEVVVVVVEGEDQPSLKERNTSSSFQRT